MNSEEYDKYKLLRILLKKKGKEKIKMERVNFTCTINQYEVLLI